jgi:tetratricopeptide (TPR) repeat protein
MKLHLFPLLIAFAALAPQVAQAQQDQVFRKSGAPTRGIVTGVSPTEITLQASGADQKFPVNEVKLVSFDAEPNELNRARQNMLTGQFEQALEDLKKIDAASIGREIVRQDVQYYRALAQAKIALTRGGDKNTAAKDLNTFFAANPGSFHYFEAAEVLGDLAMALDLPDPAKTFYDNLAKAPWPEYKMKAAVLGADALKAKGDYAAALPEYEKVIGASIDTPEASRQKLFSNLGKAECLANTGNPEEAITICEAVIKDNPSTDMELFGRAYNALGVAYLKANKPQDAALAFLHVDTLFFGDSNQHAQALYYLSDLWNQLNQADRALDARTTLKSRYAGTRWAKLRT